MLEFSDDDPQTGEEQVPKQSEDLQIVEITPNSYKPESNNPTPPPHINHKDIDDVEQKIPVGCNISGLIKDIKKRGYGINNLN